MQSLSTAPASALTRPNERGLKSDSRPQHGSLSQQAQQASLFTERLQHYSDMATFVRDRRAKYAQNYDLTPHEAEQCVREEWKLRELRRFESAKHARTLEQRPAQVRDAYEQTQAAKVSDYRGAGDTVPPAPNLKRVLLEDEPAKKRRRTGDVSHKTSADDGHELLQTDDEAASQAPTQPLKSANKNKRSKPNSQASGGAEAQGLRRSARAKSNRDDDGYAGSETPAKKRKRVHEAKEAPDKFIPCKICNKWDCDNVSNQMLICDGCDGYYHRKCISARHMSKSARKWLCHSCIKKGLLVEIMRKDKRWHRAVVTEQHDPQIGTGLLFDNGETNLLDLNTQRWRPYSVSPLNVLTTASQELEDAARGMVGIPVLKRAQNIQLHQASTAV